jgi:hypothetical protein
MAPSTQPVTPLGSSLPLYTSALTRSADNDLSINLIEAPDYNAFYQCQFHTLNNATLASSISPSGVNQILVGPPTPITGVSCQGMCIYTYGECFRNGQYLGPCCSGFCAANRCRPWVNPS